MNNFRQALENCHLTDLGFRGNPFTYSNRRKGNDEMRGRLDRAVCNGLWMHDHPKAQVHHLSIHVSDYCIIMLDTDGSVGGKRKRFFRFEAMWLDHADLGDVMRNVWDGKLGERRVKNIRKRLDEIKTLVRTDTIIEEEGRLSEELEQWLLREEVLWMQTSRISWLRFGDQNTVFSCSCQPKTEDWIKELKDSHGNKHLDKNRLTCMASEYFDNIFSPSYLASEVNWNRQLECLQPVISEEMNNSLLEDISEEEVRRAVFSMSPLKAPSLDGFPALFYQKNWGRIRGYVLDYVRDFWMNGVLDERNNKTLIVLIPKKKDADRMEDLRPISLCNVAVKIITKILVARLQGILDKKMGFTDKSINRVMLCVRTVTYQVKVNDQISKRIVPGRGLRQGDPLSPYLFLFFSDLLSAKMSSAVASKSVSGVKFGCEGPIVTHLFFADDSIFFIKANKEEATRLREITSQYEKVSGQRINLEKSEVVFSCNTPADVWQCIGDLIRIEQIEIFNCITEKIWKKISDWKGKLMSMAGKEVLVKAVVQSIPVSMMSLYYFPQKTLEDIAKLIGQYWWNKKGRRGVSWISREVLQQKEEGGIGF
ncbi:hypothetical protein QQ045_011301 [Rhodiola kirilowii]